MDKQPHEIEEHDFDVFVEWNDRKLTENAQKSQNSFNNRKFQTTRKTGNQFRNLVNLKTHHGITQPLLEESNK